MAALVQFDVAKGSRVPVLDVDDALRNAFPKQPLYRLRHARACLASADDADLMKAVEPVPAPPRDEGPALDAHVPHDGLKWVRGLQRGAEDLERRSAGSH